ncbi:hypothetical protein COCC4DRAFT_56444 [Bipolaris maydis ATCC 48331]|uniref:FAD-binding domain-containing protein n=2 Tax=Cochliobolus heterostrophus TaxID=5016 RepID=M2TSR5_COCH5|nr:uncharacterized protein COCC4DRAFT_56444 [Bipolaris maydis ATCC 48331]EMD89579.1 hypothetical protein COCHEDRAFT_1177259 [Bipolaris maydis C5]KAJ5064310.1 hypothetical protein J3E74DRAFT_262791 [Bipolaris maydis]ENI10209.1 hypothetical protein COCC4DRAFT_56444 [Bipolaris maydis ATCC 48331]KAJ6207426.1 hypothetical protein PSV09DRAFT_1177259 [Bipolaris maydis]KAJ6269911.1 hypothetical protein PSV08DRAFT_410707 [Bipolaris maydis]
MDFANGTSTNGVNGVNGHDDASQRPLNITVCGAGIGGLSAAIFLRQRGHTVTVVEASGFANELGAAVHLAPNANGLLRRIGLIPEAQGAVMCKQMTQLLPNGRELFNVNLEESAGRWQHPWQLAHRVSLHSELRRIATSEEGPGKPAVLKLRSKVVDVDPKEGTVVLESGERIQGDLIVGADGVHSKTRLRIPGAENIKTFGSGKSAFRFLFPRQKALADPDTRKFADKEGHLVMIFARDRRVVVYPTSDNTLLNFVCIHPTSESQIDAQGPGNSDWQKKGNLDKMLEVYKDFEPAVLKLLAMADEETLKVWELLDMEQLPTWTEGKLVLIGDAAHPFTPHQGQGAGQAIEDAASLAVMLPLGVPLSSIPSRLKLYERCRYDRASKIQEYSRVAGHDLGTGPHLDVSRFTDYNFGHDEWHYSSQMLRKWEWENNKSLLWRMPTVFGPMPGPRQDFYGRQRDGTAATFSTASVKVRTSRTVLENLLPQTGKFKFAIEDTTAYATFAVTQLGNLEWLGGRGYSHFGLYVHGVEYVKEDGETVVGTYLPVLFENLADPILSGREELGFPKVFADLEVSRADDKCVLDASWMSSKFCSMKLSGLQPAGTANGEAPAVQSAPPRDDGLLFHKYIPATASAGSKQRGQADVEYTAFLPGDEDSKTVEKKIEQTLTASTAEIAFDALDWKALPTLHHIVERLQEIPVYGVVEAKIVQGTGVSDVRSAQKLA